MNTSPDHPDFTALALGEHIHGTPAQAVLEALRTSVAARSEAEQIRSTAQRLAFALNAEPPARLDAARRHAILTADPLAVRTRFAAEERAALAEEPVALPERVARASWVYPTVAAAALVAASIAALRLLPGGGALWQPGLSEDTAASEPNDRIMVTAPTSPPARESMPGAISPSPLISDSTKNPAPPDKGPDLPARTKPAAPASALAKESPATNPDDPSPELAPPNPSGKPPVDPKTRDFATPIKRKEH